MACEKEIAKRISKKKKKIAEEENKRLKTQAWYWEIQGPPNKFFLENPLKRKLQNILSNFFFYLKVQSLRLIMENNFIQMAAYTIGPIFKHIIDCVQLYFTNGFTNIQGVNCQLSLAFQRNTYLWRHPTNNSPTESNRSFEVAKRHQFSGW